MCSSRSCPLSTWILWNWRQKLGKVVEKSKKKIKCTSDFIFLNPKHACQVASVVLDSLQPYGLYPTQLFCPWDSLWNGLPCLPPGDLSKTQSSQTITIFCSDWVGGRGWKRRRLLLPAGWIETKKKECLINFFFPLGWPCSELHFFSSEACRGNQPGEIVLFCPTSSINFSKHYKDKYKFKIRGLILPIENKGKGFLSLLSFFFRTSFI